MEDSLLKTLKVFLRKHLQQQAKLLLGYSGGPDSKALLHLLLECRRDFDFTLHIAHVDHGWRPESKTEAAVLEQEARTLQLPFHLKTLIADAHRNKEERARQQRTDFFLKLYTDYQCQALLLAHQADDQAEVVLKRVCEGAHLSHLCGLSEINLFRGMQVWRPLLCFPKTELVAWLNKRQLSFFTDSTNLSSEFLRGRMRTQIFPVVQEGFGKDILGNLCYLGQITRKLKSYFLKKLSCYTQSVVRGVFGSYLEIPPHLEEVELYFLFKQWFDEEKCVPSRAVMQALIAKLLSGQNARFPLAKMWIHVDRQRVFLLRHPLPLFTHAKPLTNFPLYDTHLLWSVQARPGTEKTQMSWKNVWQGEMQAYVLDEKPLTLVPFQHTVCAKEIKERRRKMQVPSFLSQLPVVCAARNVLFDCLSGFIKLNNNYKSLEIIDIKLDLFNKEATN